MLWFFAVGVPYLQRSMIRYFTSNPASKTLCFPMLLFTFSHYSFFHMVANMYVLWSFSSSIVSMLGREQFMAVYMSAGVISTMFSYVCKTASGCLGPSLGAVSTNILDFLRNSPLLPVSDSTFCPPVRSHHDSLDCRLYQNARG
uniref:rhomboid protease n=1 Tax=Oncorhynchus tshawytscha TaxID=74940 RepID=A0A8C8CXD1_ONCTS